MPKPNEREPEEKRSSESFAAVSRNLFKARTVLVFGEVTHELAQSVTAQLLAL